jgi:hypothetical protein
MKFVDDLVFLSSKLLMKFVVKFDDLVFLFLDVRDEVCRDLVFLFLDVRRSSC